jgi:DNA-binding HxlR family transcriptional regulator
MPHHAPHLGLVHVQHLEVGVQRSGEVEGRVPGVHHTEVSAQLLTMQRHGVHLREAINGSA